MKAKIVIEVEKTGDELINLHPALTECALTVQMLLLLGAMKGIGFISRYEVIRDKTTEIHVYPKTIEDLQFVTEGITRKIQGFNSTVKFFKERRKARLKAFLS